MKEENGAPDNVHGVPPISHLKLLFHFVGVVCAVGENHGRQRVAKEDHYAAHEKK